MTWQQSINRFLVAEREILQQVRNAHRPFLKESEHTNCVMNDRRHPEEDRYDPPKFHPNQLWQINEYSLHIRNTCVQISILRLYPRMNIRIQDCSMDVTFTSPGTSCPLHPQRQNWSSSYGFSMAMSWPGNRERTFTLWRSVHFMQSPPPCSPVFIRSFYLTREVWMKRDFPSGRHSNRLPWYPLPGYWTASLTTSFVHWLSIKPDLFQFMLSIPGCM